MPAVAPATALTPALLAETVRSLAARPALWRPRVTFTAPGRWYGRLEAAETHEVWLLTWLPGQGTEIHDHGGSSGAIAVVQGELTERLFPANGPVERTLTPGGVRPFGGHHIHQVVNSGTAPAISVHAYAPALATQTYYRLEGDGRRLTPVRTEAVGE